MQKSISLSFLLILISFFSIKAQVATDLWVVDTEGSGDSFRPKFETAKPLTNRPLYDNQPNFINDAELVFSAADEKGNHDIILYSFRTGNFTNFSKTADRSEYSPSLTDCKQYISAVVVEPDGTQRLWLYPITGDAPELLYDDIAPVGYYDWYDNKAAMFVLGQPNRFVYARGKGNLQELSINIGRTIKTRPKTNQVSYIDQNDLKSSSDSKSYAIKSIDLKNGKTTTLGATLSSSQDFIWIDKNHLLMAQGNELFLLNPKDQNWKSLGKIAATTHQTITRMAYSAELNKLILVLNRVEKP